VEAYRVTPLHLASCSLSSRLASALGRSARGSSGVSPAASAGVSGAFLVSLVCIETSDRWKWRYVTRRETNWLLSYILRRCNFLPALPVIGIKTKQKEMRRGIA
jgi:hypothetical protein